MANTDPPTPQEVQGLHLLNRFRADPATACERILRFEALGVPNSRQPDFAVARREISSLRPAPPLAFNLELTAAARNHAQFLITNSKQGVDAHVERASLPGFTGAMPDARAQKTAYGGRVRGENVVVIATSPWTAHVSFIIDWGDGPDGLLPGRGHRKTSSDPAMQEVGMAFKTYAGPVGVAVEDYGVVSMGQRPVGGLIYQDRNRNERYDVGEGLGGVNVETDLGITTATWPSGGFRLDLPAGKAFTISAKQGNEASSRKLPAGNQTEYWAWVVPNADDRAALDALIATARSTQGEDRRRKAIDLFMRQRGRQPSVEQQKAIQECYAPVEKELRADLDQALRALFKPDAAGFKTQREALAAKYRDTAVQDWLKEADAIADIYRQAVAFFAALHRDRTVMASAMSRLRSSLDRATKTLTVPEFTEACQVVDDYLEMMRPAR